MVSRWSGPRAQLGTNPGCGEVARLAHVQAQTPERRPRHLLAPSPRLELDQVLGAHLVEYAVAAEAAADRVLRLDIRREPTLATDVRRAYAGSRAVGRGGSSRDVGKGVARQRATRAAAQRETLPPCGSSRVDYLCSGSFSAGAGVARR